MNSETNTCEQPVYEEPTATEETMTPSVWYS